MHYKFKDDLQHATQTELDILGKLIDEYDVKIIEELHKTKDWDFVVKTKNEKILRIEVKEDFMTQSTGNIVIEFECRKKPSGIATTKADYWIYRIWLKTGKCKDFLIGVKTLRNLIANGEYLRTVSGGDANSDTYMYLFKLDVINENAWVL